MLPTLVVVVSIVTSTEVTRVVRAMLANNQGGRSTLLSRSETGLLAAALVRPELSCFPFSIHLIALILLTDRLVDQLFKVSIITRD